MKTLKFLWLMPGLLAIQSAVAQPGPHLKLSEPYPKAGEVVTMTYDPSGTVVDGNQDINATVYFVDNKDYPAADIDLKPDGKLLSGEIAIPAAAKAFFIRISAGKQIDNNGEKGYVYLVYKDDLPVAGAYASEAFVLSSGMGKYLGQIKIDAEQAIVLYQKEFTLNPEGRKDYGNNYYFLIASNADHKAEVLQEIGELEKSTDEKDIMLGVNLLSAIKDVKQADSLKAVIRRKFPNGTLVKNDLYRSVAMENDLPVKDSLFNVYASKYPEVPSDKTTSLDNLRVQLAAAYLEKGDQGDYDKYYSQLKNKPDMAMTLNNTAYEWAKDSTKLAVAAKMSKESLDLLAPGLNDPKPFPYTSPKQAKKNLQYNYDLAADTYGWILYKQNKFDEALKYEQPVIDHGLMNDPEVDEHYMLMLNAAGQFQKATTTAETIIKAGNGTEAIKQELKKNYITAKGSDKGFDQYLASLEAPPKAKALAEIAKTMINQPAPGFTLKDLDGNTVSLADLKGKVVVVDFWATWCGPCKASFPGMQMAVNKYKDDPNVKFLFVDCWETSANYIEGVKKFIAENKYTFHVLLDEKAEDGRQAKVISSYKVSGIPTKFIIDKDGNIRFKYIGYSGTTDKVFDEVNDMIELTRNPELVNATSAAVNKGK